MQISLPLLTVRVAYPAAFLSKIFPAIQGYLQHHKNATAPSVPCQAQRQLIKQEQV